MAAACRWTKPYREAVRFTAGAAPPYNCNAISINVKLPARAARSIAYLGIVVRVLQRNDLAAC